MVLHVHSYQLERQLGQRCVCVCEPIFICWSFPPLLFFFLPYYLLKNYLFVSTVFCSLSRLQPDILSWSNMNPSFQICGWLVFFLESTSHKKGHKKSRLLVCKDQVFIQLLQLQPNSQLARLVPRYLDFLHFLFSSPFVLDYPAFVLVLLWFSE